MNLRFPPPASADHLRVPEVAALLGVGARTVWAWIADGRLRATRLGPRITRVARADLQQFLDAARRANGGVR